MAAVFLFAGCGAADDVAAPRAGAAIADLGADSNRDGVLDESDEPGEEFWTADHGAAFLPNLDDDDEDGTADAADDRVSAAAADAGDRADLAPIVVRAWPEAPTGAVGRLTIDEGSVAHVRLFLDRDGGGLELVAGAGACRSRGPGCREDVAELAAGELRAGARLALEGLVLAGTTEARSWDPVAGKELPWSGIVQLRWEVLSGEETNEPLAADVVELRVAPWIMRGNLSSGTDTVLANDTSPTFMAGLEAATQGSGVGLSAIDDWPSDHWTQDYFQTGSVSVPSAEGVQGMRLTMPRPWGPTGEPSALPVHYVLAHHLGKGAGAFATYLEAGTGDTYDSFGNHELIPAYVHGAEDYPLGRILLGSGVLPETRAFYEAQRVQAPLLSVDTSWLAIGHVDEVVSFVPAATPRGWKMLVASPRRARDMLLAWQTEGHGTAAMFVGKSWADGAPAEVSIDEVLGDVDRMAASERAQAHIDAVTARIAEATGLDDSEMVPMPFLFEAVQGKLVAYSPATVNALVLGDRIVVADPFGPRIDGVDGFKRDILERLGTALAALGSAGEGLGVFFVDDWDRYHRLLGDVHCGANVDGRPDVRWWE